MVKSLTTRLVIGLLVTLAAVGLYSWYTLHQLSGLRQLQVGIIDRNRRDSLQLLRMQNALNQVGLALRDIAQGADDYGIVAYQNELANKRSDLEDAFQTEGRLSPATRTVEQQRQLEAAIRQFWQTVDQMFAIAKRGDERSAQQLAGTTLSAQQSSLSALVARLLFQNNEVEEQAVSRVTAIYDKVSRDIYVFVTAMLVAIAVTGLGLIYSNRRVLERVQSLSQQRRILAARLITVQEEVLRSVSRELHDEFGQILTAVGAMLTRAEKMGLPPDSPIRAELSEVRQITQETLEKMRSLSQMLHPAVLDDYGLVRGLDWYVQLFQKQTGIETTLEVDGDVQRITGSAAIHCFRIVQEALTNVARHAQTKSAEVTLRFTPHQLEVSIRDFGIGAGQEKKNRKPGLGLVAMQERAELLRGRIEVKAAERGRGTLVTLRIPLPQDEGQAYLTEDRQETQVVTHD
jgi:signal transduction histidine kinase